MRRDLRPAILSLVVLLGVAITAAACVLGPRVVSVTPAPATTAVPVDTALVLVLLVFALVTQTWWLLWTIPLAGYGFAWAGHYFFEKNKPATFKYPLFSLASDFLMFRDILLGRIPLNPKPEQETSNPETNLH